MRGGEDIWLKKVAKAAKAAKVAKAARGARAPEAEVKVKSQNIETEATIRLCREISGITGGVCLLGFSRGKDSIAAWLYLRRFFNRIIPFYLCSVPHLSFVDESLAYYEQWFGCKIHRFLSGEIAGAISRLVFQPGEDEDAIDALDLPDYGIHDVVDVLKYECGVPNAWTAYGINISDSIDRRVYVTKYQGKIETRKSFYPTFDWTREMILQMIDSWDIKLPKDYLLGSRSLTGVPGLRHLDRIDSLFPEDMKLIEDAFPFIRARMARNSFRKD